MNLVPSPLRGVPSSGEAMPPPYVDGTDWCRILMTVDAVGGVWRYAIELATALRPLGVRVVLAGLGPRPTPQQWREARRVAEPVWVDEPLDWTVSDENRLDGFQSVLERLVDEHAIDLVQLNLPSQASRLRIDRPVVVVSHSCLATWWEAMRGTALPAEWRWHQRRNLEGFNRADAIVTPSASQADLLFRCYGPLPGLRVVPNGIGAHLLSDARRDYVFAAGRWWDEGKNAAILDAAAASSRWPVRMAGATTGPTGDHVTIRHARALGELCYEDVLGEVRGAGILVSPSRYEPFGLAALEGGRSGAPLVLSNIATYREFWSDAAVFFDPRDAAALAAALNALADDPGYRREMGQRALARSRRFSPDVQARSMAEIYGLLVTMPLPRHAGTA